MWAVLGRRLQWRWGEVGVCGMRVMVVIVGGNGRGGYWFCSVGVLRLWVLWVLEWVELTRPGMGIKASLGVFG